MRNPPSRSNLFKCFYIALLVTLVVMSSPLVVCHSCPWIDWIEFYVLGKIYDELLETSFKRH